MDLKASLDFKDGTSDPESFLGHPEVQMATSENVLATLILDEGLNVVAANHNLLSARGLPLLNELAPMQVGDLLGCRYADMAEGGCGQGENCNRCLVRDAMNRALEDGTAQSVSLYESLNPREDAPLKVTARAFHEDGQRYVILVLQDLSAEYRRREMEHIFFHDLNNVVGALRNVEHLSDIYRDDPIALCRFVKRQAMLLAEEIASQRLLTQVATDSVEVSLQPVHLPQVTEEAIETVSAYPEAANKSFILAPTLIDVVTRSDPVLVRRVLINLLKNAVEASNRDAQVHIRLAYSKDWVETTVHNPEPVPQAQLPAVFQRSGSSKGEARGLGCWSAKLLAENYLDGILDFTSSPDQGTTFTLRLPLTKTGPTRVPFGAS